MRHRAHTRKLGRDASHRVAMYRNLVTSLLDHEKVETTHAKAMEVRRLADRMITLGKKGDLNARRRAMRVIRERDVAAKVFGELAERFRTRPGGYTRVLRTRRRVGDAAEMSIVELVEALEPPAAGKASGDGEKAGRKAGGKKAPRKKAAAAAQAEKPARKAPSKKAAGKEKKAGAAKKKTARGKTSARSDAD